MVLRLTILTSLVVGGAFACVHLPDEIRREFRESESGEASNFRKGVHGRAPGRDLRGTTPYVPELLIAPDSKALAAAPDAGPDAGPAVGPDAASTSAVAVAAPSSAGAARATSASNLTNDAGLEGATR